MEKISLLKQQLTKQFFILYFVLLAVLLIQGSYTGAYGLSFGAIMGILSFYLLANTLQKSLQMDPQKARFFVTAHYILRYTLVLLILLVAIKRVDMDFIWAVIGLLVPKAVIFGGNFFSLIMRRRNSPNNDFSS